LLRIKNALGIFRELITTTTRTTTGAFGTRLPGPNMKCILVRQQFNDETLNGDDHRSFIHQSALSQIVDAFFGTTDSSGISNRLWSYVCLTFLYTSMMDD